MIELNSEILSELYLQNTHSGIHAGEFDQHHSVEKIANQIGSSLRQLHEIPEGSLSQDLVTQNWQALDKKAIEVLESEGFDSRTLAAPYNQYSAEELAKNLLSSTPEEFKPCLTHGNATVDNFWFKNDELVSISGLESLALRDPVWDVANLHLSIQQSLGAAVVFAFYDGYGIEPSVSKLDHSIFLINILQSKTGNTK